MSRLHYFIVAIVLALLGITGMMLPTTQYETATVSPTTTRITTESIDTYTIPVTKSSTIIEAMNAYVATGMFSYTSHDFPSLGLFIDSIGGKANRNGKYWILYVNGKSSDLGASSVVVNPGDLVEWRYQKGY